MEDVFASTSSVSSRTSVRVIKTISIANDMGEEFFFFVKTITVDRFRCGK